MGSKNLSEKNLATLREIKNAGWYFLEIKEKSVRAHTYSGEKYSEKKRSSETNFTFQLYVAVYELSSKYSLNRENMFKLW